MNRRENATRSPYGYLFLSVRGGLDMTGGDLDALMEGGRFKVRAGAILSHGSLVLVTDVVGKDYHLLPGGKVRLGEKSDEACRRELEEELGLRPERLTLADVLENICEDGGAPLHELYFLYRTEKSYATEVFDRKLADFWKWIPIEKLSEYKVMPLALAELMVTQEVRAVPVEGI